MYCSACGAKNDSDALYCSQDGYPLQKVIPSGRLQPDLSTFCSVCGNEKTYHAARYCSICGQSFDIYETVTPQETTFNWQLVKKVLPGWLLSVGLLFLVSQFVFFYVYKLKQIGGYLQLQLPIDQVVRESLNFLDFSLFANLTGVSLLLENEDFAQRISYFSTGLAFMAVIAVIALVPGGYLIKRLHPKVKAWKAAIIFCFGYAALLAVITQFSGVHDVSSTIHYQTSLSFHLLSAIINGLFLGFVFSYAGMGLWEKRHTRVRLSEGERGIRYGIFTVAAAYVLMLFVTIFLNAQYDPGVETDSWSGTTSDQSIYNSMSFVGKMATYVIHLATGNTFIMKRPGPAPDTYSFLSEISPEDKSSIGFLIPPDFFASSQIVVMAIMAIFFIIAGNRMAKGQTHLLRLIVIYSLTVAVIMSFFAFYTSMNQVFQSSEGMSRVLGDEPVFIGFRLLRTFIISLLYSSVTAAIGVLVRKIKYMKVG